MKVNFESKLAGFTAQAKHKIDFFSKRDQKKKLLPLALMARPRGLSTETLLEVGKSQL
jgi:hypothetical protein